MLIDSWFILASPTVQRDQAFIYSTGSYSQQLNESGSSSNTCANTNYYSMLRQLVLHLEGLDAFRLVRENNAGDLIELLDVFLVVSLTHAGQQLELRVVYCIYPSRENSVCHS